MSEEKTEEKAEEKTAPADRLCSEIQLFDLCEKGVCRDKNGRYCTNEELLAKFEAIKEEDEANSLVYDEEELEDGDDFDDDEMSDDFNEDDYAEDD